MTTPNDDGSSLQEGLEWLDQIADEFETAWQSGTPPLIRDYIAKTESNRRVLLLAELVKIDFECRCKQGQPRQIEEYGREFPELLSPNQTLPPDLLDHARRMTAHYGMQTTDCKDSEIRATFQTLPATIGRYRVVNSLGGGGQAVVFRAVHPDLHRDVAIKLSIRSVADDPELVSQLRTEGQVLAALDHPNLARVYDCDVHEGRPFLVMEYLSGCNLERYVKQNPLSPRESAGLVARLADALAAIHRHNIIHLDLKPTNIVIDGTGRPRIVDFGLARYRHLWQENDTLPGGTPAFTSPEQAQGLVDKVGPGADIFSLGGVLYYLLTGNAPFAAASASEAILKAARCDFDRSALQAPGISRRLRTICLKAMAPKPSERYLRAQDLARKLESFLYRRRLAILLGLLTFAIATTILVCCLWPSGAPAFTLRQKLIHTIQRESQLLAPKNPDDLQRAGLHAGDLITLRCDVPKGYQGAAFIITTEGKLRELTPAELRPADRQNRLHVPERGEWQLDGPRGTVFFLVLAKQGEKPSITDIEPTLAAPLSRRWPSVPASVMLLMHREEVEPIGEVPRDLVETPYSLVRDDLEELRTHLRARFDYFWGMALAQQ